MNGSQVINHLTTVLDFPFNQTAGYLLWKDLDSVFLAGNSNTAKLFGLKHHRDLTARCDYDIPCMQEGAAQYIAQDKWDIQTQKPFVTLDIRTYHNGVTKILLINKSPFKNNQDKIIGINCHCLEINSLLLNDLKKLLTPAEIQQLSKSQQGKRYHLYGHPAHDYRNSKLSVYFTCCVVKRLK